MPFTSIGQIPGSINEIVKYINDSTQKLRGSVDDIVRIVSTISTLDLKKSDVKKFIDIFVDIIESIAKISKKVNRYDNLIKGAAAVIPAFVNNSNLILESVHKLSESVNKIVSAVKFDIITVKKAIDAVFETYFEILYKSAELSHFLLTGKRHFWQITSFFGRINLKDMYAGLLAFSGLSVALGEVFKRLQPLIDSIIKIGNSILAVKNGLKGLSIILYGESGLSAFTKRTIGVVTSPGIFSIICGMSKQNLIQILWNGGKLAGLLTLYIKYLLPQLQIIIDTLVLWGTNKDNVVLGLKTLSCMLSGNKGTFGFGHVPSIFQSINDADLDVITFLVKVPILIMALKIVDVFIMPTVKSIADKLASMGTNTLAIKSGLGVTSLILLGGTHRNWRLQRKHDKSLLEILGSLNITVQDIKQIILVTVYMHSLMFTMIAVRIIAALLVGIGGIKKKFIKRALVFVGKTLPQLIEHINDLSSKYKTPDLIKSMIIIGKLIVISGMMMVLAIELASIGLMSIPAIMGVAAAAVIIYLTKYIIDAINRLNAKKIKSAVEKLKALFPVLVGEFGILILISSISKAGVDQTIFKQIVLFIGASIELILGIAAILWIVNKLKKVTEATTILKTLLTSLFADAMAVTLIDVIQKISQLQITKQTFKQIVLFVAASSLIVFSMSTLAWFAAKLPITVVVGGLTTISTMLGSALLVVMAVNAINEKMTVPINVHNIGVLALSTLILIGLFSVVGLASPLLALAVPGVALLAGTLTLFMIVVAELLVLSLIKTQFLEQAKINTAALIDTIDEIIWLLVKPRTNGFKRGVKNQVANDGVLFTIIRVVLGNQVGDTFSLLFKMTSLVLASIALFAIMLIGFELKQISNLASELQKDEIVKSVQKVILCVSDVVSAINAAKFSRWTENQFTNEGLLFLFVRIAAGGNVVEVFDLVLKVIVLAMTVIAVGLVHIIASLLISLSIKADSVSSIAASLPKKVKNLMNTITTVISSIVNCGLTFQKDESENNNEGTFKKLCKAILPSGLIDIVDGLFLLGKMGIVVGSLALVGKIAEMADNTNNILDKYGSAPQGIADKTKNLMNSVQDSINALNGVESTENLKSLLDKTAQYSQIVLLSDKLVNKVNGLNIDKMKAFAEMWGNAAAFAKSINGNFDKLADVLTEKIAPLIQDLKNTIKDADNHATQRASQAPTLAPVVATTTVPVQPAPQPIVQQPVTRPTSPLRAQIEDKETEIYNAIVKALEARNLGS